MDNSVFKAKYYKFAGFCLDSSNRELLKDGEHVQLTQKCFETLLFLVQNHGRMLQKDEILNSVWQENFVEEANLAQHIYMIRKAFRNAGESKKLIETIPKFGYRFVGEIEVHDGPVPNNSLQTRSSGSFLHSDIPDLHGNQEANGESRSRGFPFLTLRSLSVNFLFAAAIAATILVVVYLAFSFAFAGNRYSEITSLTVLPFSDANKSTDSRVSSGLTKVLANRLREQKDIEVSSSLNRYTGAGSKEDSLAVGRRLNTDAVLFGTLHRMNGVFHINASIVQTDSGTVIWSGIFGAGDEDLFALPDAISKQVADTLNLRLSPSTIAGRIFEHPESLDSFSAYTVGVHYLEKPGADNVELAVSYLTRAVESDPEFAAAAANLADAYSMTGYERVAGFDPLESIEKAKIYSAMALKLDPDSSQALSALAVAALFEKQFTKAQKLFEQAIRHQPDNSRARQRLAWLLSSQDNLDGAITEMRLALSSKPESSQISVSLASLLRLNRQADEALKYCKRALVLDPSHNRTRVVLAEIYEQKGELDQSVRELESVPKDAPEGKAANLMLGRVYAKKGEKGQAIQILKDAKRSSPSTGSSYEVATIYASLGDKKQAVRELRATRDDSLNHYLHLKYDYNMDSIRKSPDFSAILTESTKKLASRDGDGS